MATASGRRTARGSASTSERPGADPGGKPRCGKPSRPEAELGVGLSASAGVLTAYTGLTLGDGDTRIYRAGARWRIAPEATFSLEGTREAGRAARPGAQRRASRVGPILTRGREIDHEYASVRRHDRQPVEHVLAAGLAHPAVVRRWRRKRKATMRRTALAVARVAHRRDSALRWLREVARYARCHGPVSSAVEVCAFDAAKVLDPDVEGSAYQRGPLWRTNLRGLVLARDGRACLYCGAKEAPTLDHIVAASRGGADGASNRVPACRRCNEEKGASRLETWLEGACRRVVKRRAAAILAYAQALGDGRVKLDALAAANVVGTAIANGLEGVGEAAETTSGADTAAWRRLAGVAKTHAHDAACTALQGKAARWACEAPPQIKMTGRGRWLVVAGNASGFPHLRRDGAVVAGHTGRRPGMGSARATPCASRAPAGALGSPSQVPRAMTDGASPSRPTSSARAVRARGRAAACGRRTVATP